VRFRELGLFGLIEMAFFIGHVFIAYVYIWRTGGFDWGDSVAPPVEGGLPRETDEMAAADADLAAAMRDTEASGAR
jgi:hypothetical protein